MTAPNAPTPVPPPLTQKRTAANRRNAQKSTGPHNAGPTRFNATKHALLSVGVSELDDADGYRHMLRRLDEAYVPEMIAFLKEHIALQVVRLRRIARLEAEQITAILNPAVYGEVPNDPFKDLLPAPPLIDPGLPASIGSETVSALVSPFQRYQTSIENSLFRAMNHLERLQRIQEGEYLPPAVAVDVGVHSDHRDAGANAKPAQMFPDDARSEPAGKGETTKYSA